LVPRPMVETFNPDLPRLRYCIEASIFYQVYPKGG
jgi:hypothetical protein